MLWPAEHYRLCMLLRTNLLFAGGCALGLPVLTEGTGVEEKRLLVCVVIGLVPERHGQVGGAWPRWHHGTMGTEDNEYYFINNKGIIVQVVVSVSCTVITLPRACGLQLCGVNLVQTETKCYNLELIALPHYLPRPVPCNDNEQREPGCYQSPWTQDISKLRWKKRSNMQKVAWLCGPLSNQLRTIVVTAKLLSSHSSSPQWSTCLLTCGGISYGKDCHYWHEQVLHPVGRKDPQETTK
jgi:hypothetical protein